MFASVTQRINEIQQPYGGFIKPSSFEKYEYNDGRILNPEENIHGILIGLAVDYLSRFFIGKKKEKAFKTSLEGAYIAQKCGDKGAYKHAKKLFSLIEGLDDRSIICACKLVAFDAWKRNTNSASRSKQSYEIMPDQATIENIRILVQRTVDFFYRFGPVKKDGFTFVPPKENKRQYKKMIRTGKCAYGGYTAMVATGDGDLLTKDTLWDIKVTKSKITSKHTLQILMYWIMGQHSGQDIFNSITKIGIFNPRLNSVYLLEIKDISPETISIIENEVICYPIEKISFIQKLLGRK